MSIIDFREVMQIQRGGFSAKVCNGRVRSRSKYKWIGLDKLFFKMEF